MYQLCQYTKKQEGDILNRVVLYFEFLYDSCHTVLDSDFRKHLVPHIDVLTAYVVMRYTEVPGFSKTLGEALICLRGP